MQSPKDNPKEAILPMFEAFYLESIVYAAERAVNAFKRFDESISDGSNSRLIVSNIQEALTHVAELSRIFWPSRDNGISLKRGEQLRKAFLLEDRSPLRDRRLRDALEHFDERLDIYLGKFPVGIITPEPVITRLSLLPVPIRAFRLLDIEKSAFVILDETYEFGPLGELTAIILKQAQEMLENGGRLES